MCDPNEKKKVVVVEEDEDDEDIDIELEMDENDEHEEWEQIKAFFESSGLTIEDILGTTSK